MRRNEILILMSPLLLFACSAGEPEAASAPPAVVVEAPFSGRVSGAVEGEIAGEGVLMRIDGAGPDGESYYFLTDGQGLRPLGVTFTLPIDAGPGVFDLSALDPVRPGAEASVRIDQDTGAKTLSWGRGIEGALTLKAFPEAGARGPVKGRYEFTAHNAEGETVLAEGAFAFDAERM